MKAHKGDEIVVESLHIGGPRRVGQVLEVLGEPGHEHYRVQWDDGHESIYFPSADATVHVKDLRSKSRT